MHGDFQNLERDGIDPGPLEACTNSRNRQRSIDLPQELWLIILYLMTTTDVAAFRSCCVHFNAILATHAPIILSRSLEKDDIQSVYALRGPLGAASSTAYFIRCLRPCEIAQVLA